jgi:hypothetical protein
MKLIEFTMTGTAHSQAYKDHKSEIDEDDILSFELDAGNAFDKDAIKVLWEGHHIGWVPKKLGDAKSMLARLIEGEEVLGLVLEPFVFSHEPENPVDMQLIVSVDIDIDGGLV